MRAKVLLPLLLLQLSLSATSSLLLQDPFSAEVKALAKITGKVRAKRSHREGSFTQTEQELMLLLQRLKEELHSVSEDLKSNSDLQDRFRRLEDFIKRLSMVQKQQGERILELTWGVNALRKEHESDKKASDDPWTEEGSGDLEAESLLPVAVKKTKTGQVIPPHVHEQRVKMDRQDITREIQQVRKEILHSLDMEPIRKELSRVQFNLAQSQAAQRVLEDERTADKQEIKSLQEMLSRQMASLSAQQHRLTSLELLGTNLTLQRCRTDGQDTARDLRLSELELRIRRADARVEDRARRAEAARRGEEETTRQLRVDVARMEQKLRDAEERHQETREQLDKFVRSLPKDCSMMSAPGPALIQVPSIGPTEVRCYPPWLVFQRRSDGSEDFFRDWADYRRGFGSPRNTEFWLGNELLHRLTEKGARLKVELWDVQDRYFVAEYDTFQVGPEEDRYTLEVDGHRGNASDALRHHAHMGFSTKDRDNDVSSTHCALHYTSGWWYQHCHRADLNGRFPLGVTWYDEQNHDWLQLKKVEMKLSTVSNAMS